MFIVQSSDSRWMHRKLIVGANSCRAGLDITGEDGSTPSSLHTEFTYSVKWEATGVAHKDRKPPLPPHTKARRAPSRARGAPLRAHTRPPIRTLADACKLASTSLRDE